MRKFYVVFRGYPRSQYFDTADSAIAWANAQQISAEFKIFSHIPPATRLEDMPLGQSFKDYRFTLNEVLSKPVLKQGQDSNLIYDGNFGNHRIRVWHSRMTIEDGAPFNHGITVEEKMEGTKGAGRWNTVDYYEAVN